jgi:outer membrane protein assembly factor BamB
MVFCLDMDGNIIWENDNGPAGHTIADVHPRARTYPGTRSTPTIDGDFVYDVSELGIVTCYNAMTGEKIWSRDLLVEYDATIPAWCYGHSVVVEGDNIISLVGGAKALAVALNKRTGETVLEFPPVVDPENAPAGFMVPYFFDFEGTRVITLVSFATMEGYDAKTAKRLFSIPWRNSTRTNVTAPIYRDGHLFMSTGYGLGAKGFRLTKNADGTITPTELWHEERFENHHHGILLIGDYVYGVTQGGNWMAINFLTGAIGFTARPADASEATSIHYADGLIYGLSQNSRTVILWDPKPTEFVELSRFTLPNEAEGLAWAHPVVIGGRLYLRHAQYLYCYDVKAQ